MELTWLLISSIIINIGFMMVIRGQSKEIRALREKVSKPNQDIHDEAFLTILKERLNRDGMVKTVKYLREEQGMTMVAAKQLVDRLEK